MTNALVKDNLFDQTSIPTNTAIYTTNSAVSTMIKHSGASSLHVVATAAGTGSGNAVYQDISPALTNGVTYTISFWYLQSTNGGPLTVRLSSSTNPATVSTVPALLPALAPATPDAPLCGIPHKGVYADIKIMRTCCRKGPFCRVLELCKSA